MKKILTTICAAVLAVAAAPPALAAVYLFDDEFSLSGSDCANVTFGCAALRTTAIAGGVHIEFLGVLAPGEFITGLYGNISPYGLPTPTLANMTGSGAGTVEGFGVSQDAFKADGDGYFDWKLDFSKNPPRFDLNDLLEFDLLGVTLAQLDNGISVNGPAGKNGFHFAIHTQGLANGGSGWFSGDPAGDRPTPFDVTPIPEPSTYALMGAGLLVMGAVARRRKGDAA